LTGIFIPLAYFKVLY